MPALQRLTGRIKWQPTDDGVQIVIPGRLNARLWRDFFADPTTSIVGLLFLLVAVLSWMSRSPHWGIFAGVAVVQLAASLSRPFSRKSIATADHLMLWIEWRSLGRMRKTEHFSAEQIRALRFVAYTPDAHIHNDLHQSEIQFDDHRGTHSFAFGVTAGEACALIEKLNEVLCANKVV